MIRLVLGPKTRQNVVCAEDLQAMEPLVSFRSGSSAKDLRRRSDTKLESAEKMWAVLPSGSVGNHSYERDGKEGTQRGGNQA